MDEFSADTPEGLIQSLTSAFLRECTASSYHEKITQKPDGAFTTIYLVASRDERYFTIYLTYLEQRKLPLVSTSRIHPGGTIGSDLRAEEWKLILTLDPPHRIEMYPFAADGYLPDYVHQIPECYLGPVWLKETMNQKLSAERS